jgi:hypothetical protein
MLRRRSSACLRSPWPFSRRARGLVLLFAIVTGCGSGDGLKRQAISGTVTLDGEAIARGAILFEPATDESGTAVGATIRQGSFTIARQDGPVPGEYLVRIYASSGVQAPPGKGQTERTPRAMVERLPPRYNTRTELTASVRDRSPNRYNFALDSQDFHGNP